MNEWMNGPNSALSLRDISYLASGSLEGLQKKMTIRYDTIRYIYVRSKADNIASLV